MSSNFGWALEEDGMHATLSINSRALRRGTPDEIASLFDEVIAHFQVGEDAAAARISSLESQLAEAVRERDEWKEGACERLCRLEERSSQLAEPRSKLEQAERDLAAAKVQLVEAEIDGREKDAQLEEAERHMGEALRISQERAEQAERERDEARELTTRFERLLAEEERLHDDAHGKLAEVTAQAAAMRRSLENVQRVICESEGVDGWHLNGKVAGWESLDLGVDRALAPDAGRALLAELAALREVAAAAGHVNERIAWREGTLFMLSDHLESPALRRLVDALAKLDALEAVPR